MAETTHTILCVDDEKNILHALQRLFMDEDWDLLTANSGTEGLDILRHNEVQLIVSDHRMPEMTGIEFLKQAQQLQPNAIRIILSGYADINAITAAINEGGVYRYFTKPWNDDDLRLAIKQCIEQYELRRENERLIMQVRQQNEELKRLNASLEIRVERSSKDLSISNQMLELSQNIVEGLPIALMGVACDGMVALLNSKFLSIFPNSTAIYVGANIAQFMPQTLVRNILDTFKTEHSWKDYWNDNGNRRFVISCHPFRRVDEVIGAMLLLYESDMSEICEKLSVDESAREYRLNFQAR